jgi:tetratricopeptide (TPR) repeat protein
MHDSKISSSFQADIDKLKYVIEQDPDYLPAINLLGILYYFATGFTEHQLFTPEVGYPLRDAMTKRAIELDPDDATANAYLAWEYLEAHGDLNAAARAAEKSYKAGSGIADVLRLLASLAREMQKNDSAIALGRASVARDPLCRGCYWVLGSIYMQAGRFEDAERSYRKFVSMDIGGRITLGNSLLAQGRAQEALDSFGQQGDNNISVLANKANALFSLNRMDKFGETVERFVASGGENEPLDLAAIYAWSGDADKAFYWLNKAADSGIRQLRFAQRDFLFANIHDDPRWDAFWDEHWYTEAEFAAVDLNIP